MDLQRLVVDESVSTLFPPGVLLDELNDTPIETTVFDESVDRLSPDQGVVTFDYHEAFLDSGWVHCVLAGVDQFPFERFQDESTPLTNSTGIHGDAIGETVAGYVLAFARRLHQHIGNQQRRDWSQPDWDEAWTVDGETACVVGLGSLGRGIVDRLTGLGLDVVGVRRTPTPEPGVEEVYTPDDLLEAVSEARFVVLAVPLTDRTRGMVDGETFAAMDDDAYVINVGRGGVVDQAALVTALEDDLIAGAALDVFETEPLPDASPLWGMDDVIVSPHCGAFTRDYCNHVAALVDENVSRIRDGDDLVNRVV
ncbi:D-2-hydroxyacid dehydrogenase [Halohasta litorea]|uniref:D-2-hydroxyacid dehydrogenase n=1 Tax=Halohasta litorea TaxID=869891 RepID=A0ABD6DDI0_9EURY|nr:D-2-hydroxyacid dehydrogenase [Halohasta litorea]